MYKKPNIEYFECVYAILSNDVDAFEAHLNYAFSTICQIRRLIISRYNFSYFGLRKIVFCALHMFIYHPLVLLDLRFRGSIYIQISPIYIQIYNPLSVRLSKGGTCFMQYNWR